MRPGPGNPATLLMPSFEVGAMQKTAAPTGNFGSGSPLATIVGKKHSRFFVIVQLPAARPMLIGSQSALLVHPMKNSPLARSRPSQPVSVGSSHWPSSPPTSVQVVSQPFGTGLKFVSFLHSSPSAQSPFEVHGIVVSRAHSPHGQVNGLPNPHGMFDDNVE